MSLSSGKNTKQKSVRRKPAPTSPPSVSLNATVDNPKHYAGGKKVSFSKIPPRVLGELALGMDEGGLKYGSYNWRDAGVVASDYYDATMRHLAAFWEGEDLDPDSKSGLHHLAKAMSSLTVLTDAIYQENWHDDRPPRTPNRDWLASCNKKKVALMEQHPHPRPPHLHKHRRIYISGKITDTTPARIRQNMRKFHAKEQELLGQGWEVLNPARFEVKGATWEFYVDRCIEWITKNRPTMYMLKDWKESRGARLEHERALALGLTIIYEE